MEEYNDLFIAIFQLALTDDLNHVKFEIKSELRSLGFNETKVENFLKKYSSALKNDVAKYIYEESLNYPQTTVQDTVKNKRKIKSLYVNKFIKIKEELKWQY